VFSRLPIRFLHAVVALGILAAITFFYRDVLRVNQTTVALTFVVAILAGWDIYHRRSAKLGSAVCVSSGVADRQPARGARAPGGGRSTTPPQ
jgi:hypothetical protein